MAEDFPNRQPTLLLLIRGSPVGEILTPAAAHGIVPSTTSRRRAALRLHINRLATEQVTCDQGPLVTILAPLPTTPFRQYNLSTG